MTSAGEVFVIQLARASRKANKYVRHLQRADRDDVIAAALLWCWENKHNYSLTTTLDTWFVNAVKDAYKAWTRGEEMVAAESMAEIPTGDTTLAQAETRSAAEALILALPDEYKKVALQLARGLTREEMEAKGISKRTVDDTRARIKQLRRLLPEPHEFRAALVRTRPPDSEETGKIANIDHDIAQLEAMPKHGKDCPPCWRCKWFEGYLPGKRKSVRMEIKERTVKAAVLWTERRKIRIANEVRNGSI